MELEDLAVFVGAEADQGSAEFLAEAEGVLMDEEAVMEAEEEVGGDLLAAKMRPIAQAKGMQRDYREQRSV